MDKFEIIRKYRNFINSKYYGISLRMAHLLDNYKQIGGLLTHITIDEKKYKINIIKNEQVDNVELQLVTIDGSLQCGIILIDKKTSEEAIIQDVHAFDTCYESTIEDIKTGKLVMKILIRLCKKMGVKIIKLSDTSHLNCGKYSLDLKRIYTMIHGYPWYYQFGFKFENEDDKKIVKYNYKLLKNKKVKDFKKEIFIYDEYIKESEKYNDVFIGSFIEKLSKEDCVKFQKYYIDIYNNIGLKYPSTKIMILKL